MNYCYTKNEYYQRPLLYINYRILKNVNNYKKKNIFKKEFIYLFFEEKVLNNYYNEKTYDSILKEKLIQFIYDYIVHLLNIYETNFNKQIVVVLDNFDENESDDIDILNKLINTIKKEGNRHKMKLIISGRSEFIYNKQLLYLKNELKSDKPNNREMLLYYNIELNKPNNSNESNGTNESNSSNGSNESNGSKKSNESNTSNKSNSSNGSNESNSAIESDVSYSSNESDEIITETSDKTNNMNSLPLYYFNKKEHNYNEIKRYIYKQRNRI